MWQIRVIILPNVLNLREVFRLLHIPVNLKNSEHPFLDPGPSFGG
jgi:hypothetical protein